MVAPDSSSVARSADWLAPSVLAATCGGIGRIGFAPGTFGAAVGVGLSLASGSLAASIAQHIVPGGPAVAPAVEAALLAAINLAGIPICTRAARRIGRGSDPGAIVYDEAASLPLGLLVVPVADRSPLALAAAFVLHRIFDIWKPFPCRRLEHLPAGLGIMADDWGAAAWMAGLLTIGLAIGRANGWL
jgi:phosphatidylglycerophosphatase A